jgi:hypothetical protein
VPPKDQYDCSSASGSSSAALSLPIHRNGLRALTASGTESDFQGNIFFDAGMPSYTTRKQSEFLLKTDTLFASKEIERCADFRPGAHVYFTGLLICLRMWCIYRYTAIGNEEKQNSALLSTLPKCRELQQELSAISKSFKLVGFKPTLNSLNRELMYDLHDKHSNTGAV